MSLPRDFTQLTEEQLRDLLVLTDDPIVMLTAYEELRRRGLPLTYLGEALS